MISGVSNNYGLATTRSVKNNNTQNIKFCGAKPPKLPKAPFKPTPLDQAIDTVFKGFLAMGIGSVALCGTVLGVSGYMNRDFNKATNLMTPEAKAQIFESEGRLRQNAPEAISDFKQDVVDSVLHGKKVSPQSKYGLPEFAKADSLENAAKASVDSVRNAAQNKVLASLKK